MPNAGPWHAATNFTHSAVRGDAAGQCPRYDALVRRSTQAYGVLGPRSALDLLQAVAQTQSATQGSVVNGMSTGTVDVVMGASTTRRTPSNSQPRACFRAESANAKQ